MDFFGKLLGKKEEPQSNSLYPSQSATPQPGIFSNASNMLNKLNPFDPKTGGKKKPKKTKKTKKPKKQTKYKRN